MEEMNWDAEVSNIPAAMEFVDRWLESLDCPMKIQMKVDLAMDELLANIAMYAYAPGHGQAVIRLFFDEESRTVEITLVDSGSPYNPLEKADPDVTLSAEEREIGGLGIFLVKKNMDKMEYHRDGEYNVLTISKKI